MLDKQRVLVVDDEKNIRLTVSQVIEDMGLEADSAADGKEALQRIREKHYDLILLDLKMPGLDGMKVLKKVTDLRPDIRTIIITAHGTIDSAVEAMKTGAVDFLQKPFIPSDIRDVVSRMLFREDAGKVQTREYAQCIELVKKHIAELRWTAAMEMARKAVGIDPRRPEAFNLMGVVYEKTGDKGMAAKNYRAADAVEPGYQPACTNLERVCGLSPNAPVLLSE